jgi:NAD(P)-dependent dehydrogenase (short-subunit alcohol dehydrogenase family)
MQWQRFSGKSIWITGAAAGIGRECALAFAREGASVTAVDRDGDCLAQTAQLVTENGGRCEVIRADVTNEQEVTSSFRRAVEHFGQVDIAFNNAGITQQAGPTAEVDPIEWQRVLQVNVTGVWLCMREQLRHMVNQGSGVIVNTASFAGLCTLPSYAAYVSSKHAVVGLTKTAAVEYAARGIRINAVAPGAIPTPMLERTLAGLDPAQRTAALESVAGVSPMKRLGSVREVADAVLFLCSAQASFITGVCLPVDGGWAAA